ncbi:MAG TPA: hypothetical protein VGP72_30250 [Planctomycetota bacterium]
MRTRSLSALAVCLILASGALLAGTPAPPEPPSTWRPYPQLQSVLWDENFNGDTSFVKAGTVSSIPDAPKAGPDPHVPAVSSAPPLADGKAMLLAEANVSGTMLKWEKGDIGLANTKLKLPGGHRISDLAIFCVCWAEEPGDLTLAFPGEKAPKETPKQHVLAKTWTPVTFRLSDVGGRGGHLEQTDNLTELSFMFRPHDATAFRKVYIDNVVVTVGVHKWADVLPLLTMARKKTQEMERTTATDGFVCTSNYIEALRSALKTARSRVKPKSVLVVPPRPEDGATLVKHLTAAATAGKLAGYSFVAATAPDDQPVGGLADMRTLLPSILERVQPQFVLLSLSYADLRSGARPDESLRLIMDRTLAVGSIPIVGAPPLTADLPDRPALEQSVNNIKTFCASKGAPLVEAGVMLKGVTGPFDKGELSSAGLNAVAVVWVSVLKHLEAQLLAR